MNELKRLAIVTKVIEKRLNQAEAADILCVSVRQVKQLVKQFRAHKEMGLISKKRGAIGNHRLPEGLKQIAIGLIEEKYPNFRPLTNEIF
jgi:transposase